jgi:N-acetylglucosaminyl-diphospho-decaprenol L-rhamnosyltransferase
MCADSDVHDLAVIIVSANHGHWLDACLSSVYAHAGDADVDVVVVDSGCTDDTVDVVTRGFPEARVLSVENRGFAYGNNQAFVTTNARYVLFLNPDTEILEGTFAELIAELERRPEVGLIGVRQATPAGDDAPTIRRFPTPLRFLMESLGSERLPWSLPWLGQRVLDPAAYLRETTCDWVSGSFMLARREAVLSAGLMDERFFIYCEEPDLCRRMKRAGWDVRHLPTMRILHHIGGSHFDPRLTAQEAYAHRQYIEKHFGPVARPLGLLSYALRFALRAALGGRDRALLREQRVASYSALRVLMGADPPPFTVPPATAVAPPESSSGIARVTA